MRRAVATLMAICIGTMVSAEQVLVSVGNSQDATRLVLTFESLPKWSSNQNDQALELSFDGGSFKVDPNDSASATKNARIASVTSDEAGQSIAIKLSCDCVADVFPFGSSSLIVEVREALTPSPLSTTQADAPLQPPEPAQGNPAIPLEPAKDMAVVALSPDPLADHAPPQTVHHPGESYPWSPSNAGLDVIDTLGFTMRTDSESQAIALLSRELSRAASQGLVAPGADPPPTRHGGDNSSTSSELKDRSNIKIVTSLDRAISSTLGRHPPTDAGSICIPDSEVDLAAWGDTSQISTIGQLRHRAYGENGEITADGARDLARYYIALGFGSEAAAVAHFMDDGPQKRLLQAMAEIVDHGASSAQVLDGQIHCGGKIALWAALARPIKQGSVPNSLEKMLATFSALAPHHRAHLGPVLAERLREVGLDDAARNAVNAVARGGLQSNESELVTARLELEGTRPDKARDTLVGISNGTDVTAAEALLELLEDAERRNMAPNPAWVEDAPSLARATEGTEVAQALNLAGLRGRIALGQFDELRYALAEDTPGLDSGSRSTLAISAIVEAARQADDEEFLRSEVGLLKLLDIGNIPRAERFEVARRLLEVGLADRAQPYLLGLPESDAELGTLVQVYTATGHPEKAVEVLAARSDQEALRQLGLVLSFTGENGSAIQAFEDGGSMEAAAQSAIRAGDWTWIAEHEIAGTTGVLSEAARSLSSHEATDDTSEPASGEPINGQLLSASEEIRKHAEALLSETDLASSAPPFTN